MIPALSEVGDVSPTLAISLRQCWLRVAYSRDAGCKQLRRPTERTALGTAAHTLTEKAWRGDFQPTSGVQVDEWLRRSWDQVVEKQLERLVSAWAPVVPPSPPQWPGFALTRARLLGRLREVAIDHAGAHPVGSAAGDGLGSHAIPPLPWVERVLKDPAHRLLGTPDRVERRGDEIVVVDLKSGIHQGEVTEQQRLQLLLYAHLVQVAGLPLPRRAVLLGAAGREQDVLVDPDDVAAALAAVVSERDRYNAALARATVNSLATPSPDICRGCPSRPVCPPFLAAWSEDWKVGRGVWGTLQDQRQHGGSWEIEVLAEGPVELKGTAVRVTGLIARLAAQEGETVAAVRTDVLGSPQVLRARWSTLFWPLPEATAREGDAVA